MLAAEEDRDQVRRHFADKARERELLGAETKVYHSDRYCFSLFPWRNTRTMLII
jgi:NADH dehydrogenase (ubiquinone) 1 alpha subcomplex subunit 13